MLLDLLDLSSNMKLFVTNIYFEQNNLNTFNISNTMPAIHKLKILSVKTVME